MRKILIVAVAMMASSAALAADYDSQYREPRVVSSRVYAAPMYTPYVPPMYYLPSPPQYVQDLRTGAPGRWVQLQPTFLDRLFGRGDGY
jgi:PAB1-binding protein PBP1